MSRSCDSYAGTGDRVMKTIHGPYQLDAVTPDSFSPVDADADASTPLGRVQRPATRFHPRRDVNRAVRRIPGATNRYQLTDLGKSAKHEWGGVVGVSRLHEVVLIGRPTANPPRPKPKYR
jgi:hypothetical protein